VPSTTHEHTFAVKTPVFEGPLELLIELVEKRKLLINDISLAEVTDEYMARVSHMQQLSLPNTAQFITLAATLLLIKSKSLLPVLELTDEEEEKIEDLEHRLKLYQIYREAGKNIQNIFGQNVMYESAFVLPDDPIFVEDKFTNLNALSDAARNVLTNLPKTEIKPKVQVKKVVSLEEMIDRLHERIQRQLKLRFSDLIKDEKERGSVIVGFLAVLESVKQGSILVAQARRFDDIHIERESKGTPTYR
jgi:segregation and condensation protein A